MNVERFAEDVGIGVEFIAPEAVAEQDGDGFVLHFFGEEDAAEFGFRADDRKIVWRDVLRVDALGGTDTGHHGIFNAAGERDVLEGVVGGKPVVEFGNGWRLERVGTARLRVPDNDELLGVRDGKRAVEGGVHDAEDGGVGADAKREREYDDGEEAGTFSEVAEGELEVLADILEEVGHVGFTSWLRGSKWERIVC
jgi:hypothetical protein